LDDIVDTSNSAAERHANVVPAANETTRAARAVEVDAIGDRTNVRVDRRDDRTANEHCRLQAVDDPSVQQNAHHDGAENSHNAFMRRLVTVFRAAAIQYSQDGCGFLAQAIAFNALFAVFPIIVLAVTVLGYLYGTDEAQQRVLALISTVAPDVQQTLTENFHQVLRFRGISGAVALVTLIWSGKNLFLALAYALDRALGVPKGRPLHVDIAVAIVMLPIVGVILIVATAVPILLSLIIHFGGFSGSEVMTQFVGYGTGAVLIFLIALLLYTYLPNQPIHRGFGLPGAIFVTLGWEVAQIAFGIYTTHVNFLQVYGAVSAIAILLLWFYYMGIIFLFGAQLSAHWWRLSTPGQRLVRDKRSA
jgi:membrane protein